MQDVLGHGLTILKAHQAWAGPALGLGACIEALVAIGAFTPLTPLLVVVGAGIGAGVFSPLPDGMPPASVVERFDIRRGLHDQRRLARKNCCSILDLPTSAKYDGTIERIAFPIGPTIQDAEAGLDALATRISERLMTLKLPAFVGGFDGAKAVREKVKAAAAMRCAALGVASASV